MTTEVLRHVSGTAVAQSGQAAVSMPIVTATNAMGANGQYITVLPVLDMVFAHKVDFDEDGARHISPSEFLTILQMVIESSCSGACK